MTEIEDLKAFVEVVEAGGFSPAADRLGVSKSIVSRRIARLEAELGARLLSRTTRGVSPSEAGLELKARAERILAELEEAEDAVAQRSGDVAGRLRVSVPLGFGVNHIAPVITELLMRHPRLSIDAVYTDRRVDLIAERFDAAVRIGSLEDSTLVARRVAPIHAAVVASDAYLAKHGRPESPEDLARHTCLIYTGTQQPRQWRFRSGKKWHSVRVDGPLHSDNGDTIAAAAAAGLGIAVLPTFTAAPYIKNRQLVRLLDDYAFADAGLYLVRAPGSLVPAKVRTFFDAMVERFGGEPDWDACAMHARRLLAAGKGAAKNGGAE